MQERRSTKSCTCIIPFYNEYPRILKVLKEIVKIKTVDEIICVDDGSTDNASLFYCLMQIFEISNINILKMQFFK